jgi:hypothetical protein
MDWISISAIVFAILFIVWLVRHELNRAKPYKVVSLRTEKVVKRFAKAHDAHVWISERYLTEGPHGPTYSIRRD